MTICWGQCQYPFTARDKPHQGSTANGRPAFRVQPRLLTLAPVTPMAGGQTPAASRAVDPRPAELPLWDAGPIRRQGNLDHADRILFAVVVVKWLSGFSSP